MATVTGALGSRPLGHGALAAAITVEDGQLQGSTATTATATLTGTLFTVPALAGALTATASVVGDLLAASALNGALSATAAVTGDLTTSATLLEATAVALATATGTLTVPAEHLLDGTLTATATVVGSIIHPSVLWTQISGPGTASFADDTALETEVCFSEPGVYVLRLTVTIDGYTAYDEVTITVVRGRAGYVYFEPAITPTPDPTGNAGYIYFEPAITPTPDPTGNAGYVIFSPAIVVNPLTIIFRRTLSKHGTRVGSRQIHRS